MRANVVYEICIGLFDEKAWNDLQEWLNGQ